MPGKTIEDVIAEAEIRDVHVRTCIANDRRDEALMRRCFLADAVIELHETFDLDGFVALARGALAQFAVTWHNVGNQLVEVDGDVATAEHYTTSSHRMTAGERGPARDFVVFGRYLDRLERRDGEWRIAHRRMIVDFTRTDPVGDAGLG